MRAEDLLRSELAQRDAAEGALRAEIEAERAARERLQDEVERLLAAAAASSGCVPPSDAPNGVPSDAPSDAEVGRTAREAELEADVERLEAECERLRAELAEQQAQRALQREEEQARHAIGTLHRDGQLHRVPGAMALPRETFAAAGARRDLVVWRVELDDDADGEAVLSIHKVKKARQGLFNDGDSYIVMDARNVSAEKGVEITLWIGPESELAERRGAASYAMKLEIALGTATVSSVNRVVGGRETAHFLAIWREGQYRMISGGSDTAYDPADPAEWAAVLLQVKGTVRLMRTVRVPARSAAMNHGDCFILNAGARVFMWSGSGSSAFEKREGRLLAKALAKRQQGALIEVTDCADASADSDAFFALVEGDRSEVAEEDGGDDDAARDAEQRLFSLYKISDERTGALEVVALQEQLPALDRALLDKDDAFLVDLRSRIIVWIGSGATEQEREGVLSFTEEYLDSSTLPHISKFMPVAKLDEGDEWPRALKRAFGIRSRAKSVLRGAILAGGLSNGLAGTQKVAAAEAGTDAATEAAADATTDATKARVKGRRRGSKAVGGKAKAKAKAGGGERRGSAVSRGAKQGGAAHEEEGEKKSQMKKKKKKA